MRKSLLLTALLIIPPVGGYTLGIGSIEVNSSLNEPLDAKIELKSPTERDLESLDIKLASSREFLRADIDKADILNQLNFAIKPQNGSYYIHVTSNSALREPFINFLIDIQWYSGRLLKEYTLLLDPPEVAKIKARPLAVNTVLAKQNKQSKTISNDSDKNKPFSPKLTKTDTSISYGPTLSNDTLWSVAYKMRPDTSISMDQMMIALQKANPKAFNQGNINGLMSGYTLKIEDTDQLTALSPEQAAKLKAEHNRAWHDILNQSDYTQSKYNNNIPDLAGLSSVTEKTKVSQKTSGSEEKSELKLLAIDKAKDKKGDLSNSKSNRDQLSADELEAKLALAEEIIHSKTLENEELKVRVSRLEELLNKKINLINLKDETLAHIQQAQQSKQATEIDKTAKAEKTSPQSISATTSMPYQFDAQRFPELTAAEMEVADEPEETEQQEKAESAEKQALTTDPITKTQPSEIVASSEDQNQVNTTATQTSAVQEPVATQTASAAKPAYTPRPIQQTTQTAQGGPLASVLSIIQDNMIAVGGAIAVIFAGLLALLFRRKKKPDDGFQESILNSGAELAEIDDSSDQQEDMAATEDTSLLEDETSFLSDFSTSELDSLQPDNTENDPLSEADVFIVYGRFEQAESLLKGLIDNDPDNLEYQMKLLEVYQADKNKAEFQKQADSIKKIVSSSGISLSDSDEWTKAKNFASSLDVELDDTLAESSDEFLNDSSLTESGQQVSDVLEKTTQEPRELADDEIDVDDLERQLNEFEAMLSGDFDDGDDDLSSLDLDDDSKKKTDLNNDTEDDDFDLDEFSRSLGNLDDLEKELDSISDFDLHENNEDVQSETLPSDQTQQPEEPVATPDFVDDSANTIETDTEETTIELDLEELPDTEADNEGTDSEDSNEKTTDTAESNSDELDFELDIEELSDDSMQDGSEPPVSTEDISETIELDSSEDELDLDDLSDAMEDSSEPSVSMDDTADPLELDSGEAELNELDLDDLSDTMQDSAEPSVSSEDTAETIELDSSEAELDELDLDDLSDTMQDSAEPSISSEDTAETIELDSSEAELDELDLDDLSDAMQDSAEPSISSEDTAETIELDSSEAELDELDELDLDDLSDAMQDSAEPSVSSEDTAETIELDSSEAELDELDLDDLSDTIQDSAEPSVSSEDTAETIELDSSEAELDELDLDDLSDTMQDSAEPSVSSEDTAETIELDSSEAELDELDLDDLSDAMQDSSNQNKSLEDISDNIDLDIDDSELDDNLDLDHLTDELEGISDDLDNDELPDIDKMGSKLDIARAYMDMGEKDSAINALKVVINSGDEQQVAIAKKLLEQIK